MKTDSQIQSEVMQELKWDPSVTHEHIGVSVNDGIVTLSGTVPSYIEKTSAEKAAQRVYGVNAVVEKIEVKLPGLFKRDDLSIAQAIVQQFKWNIQVPDEKVKASVENGWVELSGEVDWDFQRKAAEKSVRGLTGVVAVSNKITIKEKMVQPTVVKENIEQALKRKAEREARGAAWNTPGVTSVQNNLQVIAFQ